MMGGPVLVPLFAVWAAAQSPQSGADVRALARAGAEAAVVAHSRDRPDDARGAVRDLLGTAAARTDSAAAPLLEARLVAKAYATAWRDSFLVRQVELFASWSAAQRRLKVSADSVRVVGNDALGRRGVDAAMRAWRESLRRCELLADSAGIGAALGNMGAGFFAAGDLDSAEAYFELARDMAGAVGDMRTLGNAVGALANVHRDRGGLRRAGELYAEAAALRALTGDTRGVAADRNNLGQVAQRLGDVDGARRAFNQALALNRRYARAEPAALNLLNLGHLAGFEGDYPEAVSRYREALATYRDLGNRVGEASALYHLGLLELRRGAYRSGVAQLSDAARIYEATGPDDQIVAARRALAETRAAEGDLEGALFEIRSAERRAGTAGSGLVADLALTRADLALRFNRPAEAERQYARAERLYRIAGDAAGSAEAIQGRGALLLRRRSWDPALATLQRALAAQADADDPRPAALTRLWIGYAQRQRGDTAAARRSLQIALDTLRALGDAVGEAAGWLELGDLELDGGSFLAAEAGYQRGLARLSGRAAPSVSWQLHAGLGRALRGRGALAEAARELSLAADEIERVAGGLSFDDRRADFLADKWDVYAQLALVEHARGRGEAAFEASERLRARQMLDLLARGRVGAGDSLTAREQDLRRRIAELTHRLERMDTAGSLREPDLTAPPGLRSALTQAQDAYARLLTELRESRPEYATLVRGEIVPAREVRARLAADEALVEYLVTDSITVAFVLTSDTVAVLELGVSRAALVTLVDFARGTLTRPLRPAAQQAWRPALRRLYQALVAPVEAAGLLEGKRLLLIAPHAELHYLPFAALLRRGATEQYLIERYDLVQVLSGSAWVRLAQRPAGDRGEGILALAPRVRQLPATREEVAAIRRIYGSRAQVLLGAAASERALRDGAARPGVLHLATYGVLNKHNPLFSFVELAPGGGHDGRLEVHEVFGLTLGARLVVLSACQTALGSGQLADVPAGDDWVGLVRAFLLAGAANVLATLWPVEDRATASLMDRFYASLSSGREESQAIAAAQRTLLRNPETTHPFHWAGFALVGGP
jgi:CHAT domain-containing protein